MVTRSSLSEPTSRRGWRWAVLGIVIGALLSLVLFAPARWLAAALSNWSQGRLLLVNPRGTVWNGAAAVVLASGAGGTEAVSLPGSLNWRMRPTWDGMFAVLDLPCCTARPLQLKASPRAAGM